MRRVFTAVAIVVMVVAATVVPAEAKQKTAAARAPLVLSTKDFAKGWSVNAGAPANTPSPTAGPCNGPNAAARAVAAGSTATAEANLIKDPQAGPVIFEVVYAFPTIKQAKAFMETNRAVLASCPASDRVNTVNGRTYHDTATAIPFSKIGDDTIAYEQTDAAADGNGSAVSFNDVYVRSGMLVLSMAVGGASVDATDQYTRKALSKLAARAK